MQGLQGSYAPPEVSDYGDLVEITRAAYPPLGAAVSQDLSFSGPTTTPGGEGTGPSDGDPMGGGGAVPLLRIRRHYGAPHRGAYWNTREGIRARHAICRTDWCRGV